MHRDFVVPYKECGSEGLPALTVFMKYCQLLETKYKKTKSMRFNLYNEFLSMILNDKNTHMENRLLRSTIIPLRNYKKEALAAIRSLKDGPAWNGNGGFAGSIKMEVTKYKPLIYAQASLNVYFAWYAYLHESMQFDAKKMNGVQSYVIHLTEMHKRTGSDTAYETLIKLLDEKYDSVTNNIVNVLKESEDNTEPKIEIDAENVIIRS